MRERALSAGLVELNNEIIEVHPDFNGESIVRDGIFNHPLRLENW